RDARHEIIGRGLARTFQNVELFTRMSVLENVLCGLHLEVGSHPLNFLLAGFGWPGVGRGERNARARAAEALDVVGLGAMGDGRVAGLRFGTLKAVELARALVSRPRLLLLDEPAGGLNTEEVLELGDLIRRIHRELGLTLLVVEHHMNLVMRISDR